MFMKKRKSVVLTLNGSEVGCKMFETFPSRKSFFSRLIVIYLRSGSQRI
jgi:hypothetical protein